MSTRIITLRFVPATVIDDDFYPKHYIISDGAYRRTLYPNAYNSAREHLTLLNEIKKVIGTYGTNLKDSENREVTTADMTEDNYKKHLKPLLESFDKGYLVAGVAGVNGGSRRRRRPSRKYKKSAKRVFRKKSRSTRRR